jgi:hypothetical protein
MKTLNDELTTFLKDKGASLVGFADLREIDTSARCLSPRILAHQSGLPRY